ncbi:hypothetical protein [Quadrisphaera sp. DSM 44207]|uniref:hypothetical protein n=1 Tax=Quadrisphaera sp. DSM 44207 TaxID=1881057 RepID=UPI00088EC4AE|nr:hypothetical protein [Quadrisphaera sp. DSM 44207]SDQ48468.1 hypothetical protein SAMN05428996_1885 [Quadrisphaera sp. DSM 44207]
MAEQQAQDGERDVALESLDALCRAVRASIADAEEILVRAGHLRAEREAGRSYAQIVPAEGRPLIVELLTSITARLSETGSRWRREEARALHAEGLTMDRIAALFGVTRQRVSALLRSGGPDRGGGPARGAGGP